MLVTKGIQWVGGQFTGDEVSEETANNVQLGTDIAIIIASKGKNTAADERVVANGFSNFNKTVKTLQTGGHTLNKSTLKALGLTKEQGKIAIEGLKKDLGLRPDFYGKIMSNGDLVNPNTNQVLGNLLEYLP